MKTIRKSILAAVGVVSLLSTGASPAWAQSQPAPAPPAAGSPASTDVETIEALNRKAIDIALGTQPIAADQLALGERFVAAMNLRAALDHPAIFETLGAAGGSMEVSRVLSERATAGMGERFKVRLCAAMKTRALESGGCPKA